MQSRFTRSLEDIGHRMAANLEALYLDCIYIAEDSMGTEKVMVSMAFLLLHVYSHIGLIPAHLGSSQFVVLGYVLASPC